MNLFETAGNPVPPGAIVAPIVTSDRVKLRTARWLVRAPRGTVTIALGRSEFIEEYFEVVAALLMRRLNVVVFDWRGQGQSDREIAYVRRGYVSRFAAYRRDLEALEQQILEPFTAKPWFGIGHSMGAAILLDQAHDGGSPFERLVLSAPMIDIVVRHRTSVRRIIRAADRAGLGTSLVPGGREESMFIRSYDDNILTSDARQFKRMADVIRLLPHLTVGAPTVHWLAGAFDLMKRFNSPIYPIETMTPILILAAGADRIVDTAAIERFAIRLKVGRCITIPHARHQLLMECEAVTAQVWAAIDAFLPGHETYEVARMAPMRPMPRCEPVSLM